MPRRKELRGAAFGLLGSFVSRNNDVSGYWALGKLYRHAVEAKASTVSVDLLDLTITPPNDDFAEMALHFQKMLGDQLKARGLPADWVRAATVSVKFERARTPNAMGDVFNCMVVITDDEGRQRHASTNGTCWMHDPAREAKSDRT